MTFRPLRAVLFLVLGLPVGFVLTAFGFAVVELAITGPAVFPWAIAIAVMLGIAGGFSKATN